MLSAVLLLCFHSQVKELVAATKESDRLSEELNSQAVKVKWAQNKLKTELETHKVKGPFNINFFWMFYFFKP